MSLAWEWRAQIISVVVVVGVTRELLKWLAPVSVSVFTCGTGNCVAHSLRQTHARLATLIKCVSACITAAKRSRIAEQRINYAVLEGT